MALPLGWGQNRLNRTAVTLNLKLNRTVYHPMRPNWIAAVLMHRISHNQQPPTREVAEQNFLERVFVRYDFLRRIYIRIWTSLGFAIATDWAWWNSNVNSFKKEREGRSSLCGCSSWSRSKSSYDFLLPARYDFTVSSTESWLVCIMNVQFSCVLLVSVFLWFL